MTDAPDYPAEWTPEQRLTAYWYANGHQITARSTAAWHGILTAAEHEANRRHNKIATIRKGKPNLQLAPPPPDDDEVPF